MLGLHIAARENFQCGKKFLAKIILTTADTGQRRGRTDHRTLADLRPVIGLHAPDGGDEVAVDAISLLDRIEGGAVFRENCPAVLDTILVHQDI